jgi:hypothetical protein
MQVRRDKVLVSEVPKSPHSDHANPRLRSSAHPQNVVNAMWGGNRGEGNGRLRWIELVGVATTVVDHGRFEIIDDPDNKLGRGTHCTNVFDARKGYLLAILIHRRDMNGRANGNPSLLNEADACGQEKLKPTGLTQWDDVRMESKDWWNDTKAMMSWGGLRAGVAMWIEHARLWASEFTDV